jgi:hypothetical protein
LSGLFGVLGIVSSPVLELKPQWTFEFRRADSRERGTTIA